MRMEEGFWFLGAKADGIRRAAAVLMAGDRRSLSEGREAASCAPHRRFLEGARAGAAAVAGGGSFAG